MRGGGRLPEDIALDRKSATVIADRLKNDFASVKQDIADGADSDWLLKNFGGDQSLVDAFNQKQLSEYGRKAELASRGFIPDRGARSDMLHELQHAVQQRQGFARGGSPNELVATLDETQKISETLWKQKVAQGMDPSKAARDALSEARNQVYKRLAGEAEARAVQSRMNLSPLERRALFPLDSYDVPIDDLIVR
jgi:hypothetical protein